MNVLFVANCMSVYGANRSMFDLANSLRKMGCDAFFFFPLDIEEPEYVTRNILRQGRFRYKFFHYYSAVHQIGNRRISYEILESKENIKSIKSMIEYVHKWNIDIIHTNSLTHTIGAWLALITKKPHVWHIRENLISDYALTFNNSLTYRFLLRKAARVICISNSVRKTHHKILDRSRVTTIYNGFEVNKYLLHDSYCKNPKVFHMIICGVVRREKGQLDAVKAIERLVHEYGKKNVYLKIIGNSPYGDDYYEKVNSYIEENELDKYVELVPFQEDLSELRKEADIALVCSRAEAFGRVTVESMLSENIVIGADSAGTTEILKHGKTGYLYKTGCIDDLCTKLLYVMNHWEAQENIVKRAQQYATNNYSNADYAKKMLKIYKCALNDSNNSLAWKKR